MSTVIEKQLDTENRDDIVTSTASDLWFWLLLDVECGDCGGEGEFEVDTTRAIHWEPHTSLVQCDSCEGTGWLPEPLDVFIQRAVDGRSQLASTPKRVIAAMIAMAQQLDEVEGFEIDTKRLVALSLGYRVPAGRDPRHCNELDR